MEEAMEFFESLAKALVASGQAEGNGINALWKRALQVLAKESKTIHDAVKADPHVCKEHFKDHIKKAQKKQEKAAARKPKQITGPSDLALFVLGLPPRAGASLSIASSPEAAESAIIDLCRQRTKPMVQMLQQSFAQLETGYTTLARPEVLLKAMMTYMEMHLRDHTSVMNIRRVFALYTCIWHHTQTNLHPSAGIVWSLDDSIISTAYLLRYWHSGKSDTTERMCRDALHALVHKLVAAGHGITRSSSDHYSSKPVAVYAVIAAASILATLQSLPKKQR